jgi:glutaredoxin
MNPNTQTASTGKKLVEIFTTPVCHYCQLAKEFFAANGVEYSQYDVTKDLVRRQELIDLGAMGVPLIRISGGNLTEPAVINGFDEGELRKLLGL